MTDLVLDIIEKPSKAGRPSKLTKETKDLLFNALVGCRSVKSACAYAGIGESTYRKWKNRGEKDKVAGRGGEYVAFVAQVQRALDLAKPRLEMIVSKGAEKDYHFALTILERRYPDEWGHRQYVETKQEITEEVNVHGGIEQLLADPKTRDAALRLLEAAGEGEGDADGASPVRESGAVEAGKAPDGAQP
jgi:hypothetical protein